MFVYEKSHFVVQPFQSPDQRTRRFQEGTPKATLRGSKIIVQARTRDEAAQESQKRRTYSIRAYFLNSPSW